VFVDCEISLTRGIYNNPFVKVCIASFYNLEGESTSLPPILSFHNGSFVNEFGTGSTIKAMFCLIK
jgi:hypothetical protein